MKKISLILSLLVVASMMWADPYILTTTGQRRVHSTSSAGYQQSAARGVVYQGSGYRRQSMSGAHSASGTLGITTLSGSTRRLLNSTLSQTTGTTTTSSSFKPHATTFVYDRNAIGSRYSSNITGAWQAQPALLSTILTGEMSSGGSGSGGGSGESGLPPDDEDYDPDNPQFGPVGDGMTILLAFALIAAAMITIRKRVRKTKREKVI